MLTNVTVEAVNAGLVLQEANKDGARIASVRKSLNPAIFRYADRTALVRQWEDRTVDIDVASSAGFVYRGSYAIDTNNCVVGSTIVELTLRELIKISKGSRLHQIYMIPDGESFRFVIGRREGSPARFVYVAFDLRLTPQFGTEQTLSLARIANEERFRCMRALTQKCGDGGFLYPRGGAPTIPTKVPLLAIEGTIAPIPNYSVGGAVSIKRSGDYKIVVCPVDDIVQFDIVSETLEWAATARIPERDLGMPIRKFAKKYFQPRSYVRVCRLDQGMALVGGTGAGDDADQLCASVAWVLPLITVACPLYKACVGAAWADIHMRTMASCIGVEFEN